jgi:hypothetical protein
MTQGVSQEGNWGSEDLRLISCKPHGRIGSIAEFPQDQVSTVSEGLSKLDRVVTPGSVFIDILDRIGEIMKNLVQVGHIRNSVRFSHIEQAKECELWTQ